MKALVEELRSERFDRGGTIVRVVGVVALIGLESVAARARAGNRADGLVNRAGGLRAQPPLVATLRLTLQQRHRHAWGYAASRQVRANEAALR